MGSTRKKNGGKKNTLKYGGGRNNYKKGSFKNRRKMTIRNGGGKYDFKDTDTEEKTKVKLERMYEKLQNESSKKKDQMLESWTDYISRLVEPKKSEMIQLEKYVKAKYPHSTGRKSPSPSRGSAAAASASSSAARALEDEDDLYRQLSDMRIKPAQSKQTRKEFNDLYRQITGEESSSDKMSDADFKRELDRILSGSRSPSKKFTPEQEKELDAELDRIFNSE